LKNLIKKHSMGFAKLRASVALGDEQKVIVEEPSPTRKRKHLSAAWKEGCRLMRQFIFGCLGNEGVEEMQDKDAIYYEKIGSRGMVADLYGIWSELDNDHSGRVDIAEFRHFAEQRERDKTKGKMQDAAMLEGTDSSKFIQKLCERLEKLLLGKKSSFVIEDMMRLCWPTATIADIKTMTQWCHEHTMQREKSKIRPPPTMPKAELDGLMSVFRLYDEDYSGSLHVDELVKQALVPEEEKQEWCRQHNGQTELNALEFCEMMCPAGFRATAHSTCGTLPDGRHVVLDSRLACWRLADIADDAAADSPRLSNGRRSNEDELH